ncbi:hypothetical protein [Microcoleus sp. B9-D4]
MPVPQQINFLVEQASCLLLTMVQDLSSKVLRAPPTIIDGLLTAD